MLSLNDDDAMAEPDTVLRTWLDVEDVYVGL